MMKKKIARKKRQESAAKGRPAWVDKLSSSDRRKWEAVDKANKRKAEKKKTSY